MAGRFWRVAGGRFSECMHCVKFGNFARRSTQQTASHISAMPPHSSSDSQVFIQGITSSGRAFRPSDWAERLAGVMSQFRPGNARPSDKRLCYSPWCVPTTMNNIKCVVVSTALRQHEPMAWDFVMNFARDNDLQVVEACLVPEK